MSEEFVSQETLEPDEYLGPRRYKISCKCLRCGNIYNWTTTRVTDDDRPCPRKACKAAALEAEINRRAANMAKMLDEQRAPGHIGANLNVRAIDETARVVMEDHHMTDLKDNIRMGESMAPKLPPQQQYVADNFFSGEAVKTLSGMQQRKLQMMGQRAIRGAFRGSAANPASILGGTPGEKIFRSVGKETI